MIPAPPPIELAPDLLSELHEDNPWWRGLPAPIMPTFERNLVGAIERRLAQKLAPVVVVRGPRQVGKTTSIEVGTLSLTR